MPHDTILILDLGCASAQLLARQIRQTGVYGGILTLRSGGAALADADNAASIKGIILVGEQPVSEDAVASVNTILEPVLDRGLPVLALDGGMQVLLRRLGGSGTTRERTESFAAQLRARGHTALLRDLEDEKTPAGWGLLNVWQRHDHEIRQMPEGCVPMLSTLDDTPCGFADQERQLYGLPFHPELIDRMPQGQAILRRFAVDICKASPSWSMQDYAESAVQAIRQEVGGQRVLLGLSGGVDSTVAAALIHRAIGDQLVCVFVDHGLLRLNEARQVMQMMAQQVRARVVQVDASDRFLAKLAGISDPEQKRKAIGAEFVAVFKAQAHALMQEEGGSPFRFLAQGTIYPDVIESGSQGGAVIKSHHNVGGLPEQLGLDLLEPLRPLFKDEVRKLGLALGLAPDAVFRHPFPGPGLGVRILGEVKREYADILRQADAIFVDTLRHTIEPSSGKSWYELTSQAFAVFLPVRSVGVSDGARTYEYAVALRAVQTTDFMTAECAALPWELLREVSKRIIAEVPQVNRVTFDISGKPPATIEWE